MKRYKSIKKLLDDVNRISSEEYKKAFNYSKKSFSLIKAVGLTYQSPDSNTFAHTSSVRDFSSGEAGNASCDSTPPLINSFMGKKRTYKGWVLHKELAYKLCLNECSDESLRRIIIENERTLSVGLMRLVSSSFWHGNPESQQFGILNHPLVEMIELEPNGKGGSTTFESKTNNQIINIIADASKGMEDPVILVPNSIYSNVFSSIDSESVNKDRIRVDIILSILAKRQDININSDSIKIDDTLDSVADFGGKPVVIIYDKKSVSLGASPSIYFDAVPSPNSKNVIVRREIAISGLIVKYQDSLKIIMGA